MSRLVLSSAARRASDNFRRQQAREGNGSPIRRLRHYRVGRCMFCFHAAPLAPLCIFSEAAQAQPQEQNYPRGPSPRCALSSWRRGGRDGARVAEKLSQALDQQVVVTIAPADRSSSALRTFIKRRRMVTRLSWVTLGRSRSIQAFMPIPVSTRAGFRAGRLGGVHAGSLARASLFPSKNNPRRRRPSRQKQRAKLNIGISSCRDRGLSYCRSCSR